MDGCLAAPRAELLELDLPLHLLLILMGIVIAPLADGAAEGDQIVGIFNLCHTGYSRTIAAKMQLPYNERVRRLKGKVEFF